MLEQAKPKKGEVYEAFAPTGIIDEDDEPVYTVEAITDSQLHPEKGLIFRVQWLGYPGEDTWELVKQISHLKRLINRFYEANPTKPEAGGLKLRNQHLSNNPG